MGGVSTRDALNQHGVVRRGGAGNTMARSLRKRPRFELFSIARFDTRRGYARCDPPGIDVAIVGERQKAHANIWRAADGGLVLRLRGWRLRVFLRSAPNFRQAHS